MYKSRIKYSIQKYQTSNKHMQIRSTLLDRVSSPNQHSDRFQTVKQILLVAIVLLYCLYVFYPHPTITPSQCLYDAVHQITKDYNQRLFMDANYRFRVIVAGQLFIDIALIGLMVIFVAQFNNFAPLAWMLGFYLMRAAFLQIYRMPFPDGIYWQSQGVFTVGVPYGVTRDFFYSGHTGFMVYSIRVWGCTKYKGMKILMIIGLMEVIWLVTVTRVHYIIDIMGGVIFSQWFYYVISTHIGMIDLVISKIVYGVVWGMTEMWIKIQKNMRIFLQIN